MADTTATASLRHSNVRGATGRCVRRDALQASDVAAVFISALLFAVAFPAGLMGPTPPGAIWLAPLALIALAPWLLAVWRGSWRRGAALGFALGTASGVVLVRWIAGGLASLGTDPWHAWLGVGVVAAYGAGLPWAAIGALAAFSRRRSLGLRIGVFALVVGAVELAWSHLPFGAPWALLGHTQAGFEGVAQLATVAGVPLVSALLAAGSAATAGFVLAWRGDAQGAALRAVGVVFGAYAALTALGLPVAEALRPPSAGSPLAVLAVQPNLPAPDRWVPALQRSHLAITARQTERALAEADRPPDLVVWPETLLTTPVDADADLRRELEGRVDRLGVPVVLGAARSPRHGAEGTYRNSALWVEPGRGIVAGFDKTWAIPGIESARPLPVHGLLTPLLGRAGSGPRVEEAHTQGPLRGAHAFAVPLCVEVVFPGLVGARTSDDAAAILNLANDGWFREAAPGHQQVAIARFRAIEQRRWLLRVAHGGVSAAIDPFGRVVAELPFGARGAFRASIVPAGPAVGSEQAGILALAALGGAAGLGIIHLVYGRRPT